MRKWIFLKNTATHLAIGKWGERKAAKFLKKKGYKILGKRVRIGKHDEVDILAQEKKILVFVEVKTRKSDAFGRPSTAVNHKKQKRLSRAAAQYLSTLKKKPDYIRFDIVEVIGLPGNGSPQIYHIPDAFQADSCFRFIW